MRRWLTVFLCLWVLQGFEAIAQKIIQRDQNPPQRNVPGGGRITRIEYTRHKLIVHFVAVNNERATLSGPGHRNAWRLVEPQTGRQYALLYIKNIRVDGEQLVDYLDEPRNAQFYRVRELTCEAHFERPPKEIKLVNLIEEDVEFFENRPSPLGGSSSQWPYNVYDVRVLPYDDAEEARTTQRNNRPSVTTPPPAAKPNPAPATKGNPAPAPQTSKPTTPPRPAPRDTGLATGKASPATPPKVENLGSRVEAGRTYRLNNLLFEQSDWHIQPTSYAQLDSLAAIMKRSATMEIELAGHTDNVGDPRLNVELARQRVDAVKSYLVSKGIAGARIKTKAYGGSQPVADNTREETRRLNRRVEVTILRG